MEFGKPRKIFIVDDNELFSKTLSNYLNHNSGHSVSTFCTGEECLKNISENPDVFILDFYLDSVRRDAANGLEILKTIRKYDPVAHVIMLSGQESYEKALQTIQKGAEQYVIKDNSAFEKISDIIRDI